MSPENTVMIGIWIGALALGGSIWMLGRCVKRFRKLVDTGARAAGTITGKPSPWKHSTTSWKYPDINNGFYMVKYRFTAPDGREYSSVSYVSRDFHGAHREGDAIEIVYDSSDPANNKPLHALQRDTKATTLVSGLLFVSTLIIGAVMVYAVGSLMTVPPQR